jgi:hypothetical protein
MKGRAMEEDEVAVPIIVQTTLKGLSDEAGTIVMELALVMSYEDLAARKISSVWRGQLIPEQAEALARDLMTMAAHQEQRLSGKPPN